MKERNQGIDLLRIISMFMIVTEHILLHGGAMTKTEKSYILTGILMVISVCAVNCYAMISGFVGYRSEAECFSIRLRKYVLLWLQVITYSFGITLVIYIAKFPSISTKYLIEGILPVTSGFYWYFTAYTGLFFSIPFINSAITNLNQSRLKRVGLTCLIIIPLYSQMSVIFMKKDVFFLSGGYTYIWLVILYVIGAWIRQSNIVERLKTWHLVTIWLACVSITYISIMMKLDDLGFASYISPTIVISAFVLMIGCLKLGKRIKNNRIISFIAPATFGIYLLHENNLIRKYLISNRFVWISKLSPVVPLPLVIGIALFIFTVCLFVEKARIKVFKLLHIQQLINKITFMKKTA